MKNKRGQASLEYTIIFVMVIVVVMVFASYFKSTLAVAYKAQIDKVVAQLEDENCCEAGDLQCRIDYREDFCDGETCPVPVCLVIPQNCTPEEIFSEECDELD